MKDLRKLYRECIAELDSIGMDYSSRIVEVKVNGRLKTTLGYCKRNNVTGNYTIEVAPCMLADGVEVEAIKDTIIHEILHTCPGSFNHGYEWKHRASIVNRKLGYNIETCASTKELEAQGVKVQRRDWKYALECVDCGKQFKYKRWCESLENPSRYRCGSCHGELKTISLDDRFSIARPVWTAASPV